MKLLKILGAFAALFLLVISCKKDSDLLPEVEATFTVSPNLIPISKETPVEISEKVCTSKEHQHHLLQDQTYRKNYETRMRLLQQDLKSHKAVSRGNCSNPTIIPVAIHFQDASPSSLSCLRELATKQIQRLNEDYRGQNSDISKWGNGASSYFSGVNYGDVCIEFRIADKNHPTGTGLQNGDLAVTAGQNSGDRVSAWSGYLNIFVRDLDKGNTTGYAPIGGRGNGDGVIIDDNAFGTGVGCAGAKPHHWMRWGRTIVHEIGHYLTLDHIWGDGCHSDDGVSDTPGQETNSWGCEKLGKQSCGSNDLFMNYMDYSSESCQYMFTVGQADRMFSYVTNYLKPRLRQASEVIDNVASNGDSGGGNTSVVCTAPSEFSEQKESSSSATIFWNHVNVADQYQIRIQVAGYGGWSTFTTSGNQVTYNGLQENLTYEYQLRSKCFTGEWSDYAALQSFSIGNGNNDTSTNDDTNSNGGNDSSNTADCQTPANLAASQSGIDALNIRWDAVTGATNYQLQIRFKDQATWYKFEVPYTDLRLTGVHAGYTYEYQVRTACDNEWSDFSELLAIEIR